MKLAARTRPEEVIPRARIATLDITVLAGGPGAEREVSLNSGQAVAEALSRIGHKVTVSDIGPADLSSLDRPADFVFIALHGEFGEDGTVQAELDARGLCYSGSGATASRTAIDKVAAKRCFDSHGVPTPRYHVVKRADASEPVLRFTTPAVVKPVTSGSSVDISIVRTPDALQSSAMKVARTYGQALIEEYIRGPELTVGILGDRALPVCEIRTSREFYDYQAKYLDDDTQYLFDLDLPSELLQQVQTLGLRAHQCLGCGVFSRVDVMVEASTNRPYVLEVNTIPGFTNHSLLPKAAARIGLNFDQLCQRIVELSLAEHYGTKAETPS